MQYKDARVYCQAEEEAEAEEEAAEETASTQENYISSYCKQKKIQKDNKAAAASLNLQRT